MSPSSLEVIANDITYIRKDIEEIKLKMKSDFVTQAEFAPIKSVVYGLVGTTLTGVLGAILALIILK
jgi:hypothetical protein